MHVRKFEIIDSDLGEIVNERSPHAIHKDIVQFVLDLSKVGLEHRQSWSPSLYPEEYESPKNMRGKRRITMTTRIESETIRS